MTGKPIPRATLWALGINAIAVIGFACAPGAQEYPLATVGIVAFLLVQACLPACRISLSAPVCPTNIAQGYYWVQLVLVTVLMGYFGFSQGTLPYLPSKGAINVAIAVQVVGYLAFCVAYECFGRVNGARTVLTGGRAGRPEGWLGEAAPGTAYLIVPFAVLGLVGFLFTHGGVAGFIDYVASPVQQRLRAEQATTVQAAAGSFLKHFLGFAVVLAWSWWLGRARRRKGPVIAVTAGVVIVLLIANFSYNRGTMLGPIVGVAAAFSVHVRRIPFKGVVLAGVLALCVALVFGWYRSADLDITDLSASLVEDARSHDGVVDFVQIYASAPQLTAYMIEGLEGKFYYGETLLPSLVYPIPVLGKPYRERSGTGIFNELIYGDADDVDQVIPLDGELFINFHLAGVVLGNVLLGCFLAWLQVKFVAARNAVESYAWVVVALWTVFPGSLAVISQMYVYSFWPIYSYFAVKKFWPRGSAVVGQRGHTAVTYS